MENREKLATRGRIDYTPYIIIHARIIFLTPSTYNIVFILQHIFTVFINIRHSWTGFTLTLILSQEKDPLGLSSMYLSSMLSLTQHLSFSEMGCTRVACRTVMPKASGGELILLSLLFARSLYIASFIFLEAYLSAINTSKYPWAPFCIMNALEEDKSSIHSPCPWVGLCNASSTGAKFGNNYYEWTVR